MNKFDPKKINPIYTTRGDVDAFILYPMLYNPIGEWIGWVTPKAEVYSVHGDYVGWLTEDPRILRKRTYDFSKPTMKPPAKPTKVLAPASVPLPPMMAELSFDTIDVLYDEPERLPTLDSGDALQDMD